MSQFLLCPICKGTGRIDTKICKECQGIGLGAWHQGRFIYWGRLIDKEHILERKIKKFIRIMINFFLVLFGLFGLGILVYWFLLHGNLLQEPIVSLQDDKIILLFWLSVLIDLFLIYRIKQVKQRRVRIEKTYSSALKGIVPSSLNEVIKLNKKYKIDISQFFSSKAHQAIERAYSLAEKFDHSKILPIHFFASLLQVPEIKIIFARLGIGVKILEEKIGSVLEKDLSDSTSLRPTPQSSHLDTSLRSVLQASLLETYLRTREKALQRVDVEDLLAFIAEKGIIREVLYEYEIDQRKLENAIAWTRVNRALREKWQKFRGLARFKPRGVMNRAMTAVATPFLDQFSEDLTILAKLGYLPLCVDREKEMQEIFRILEGSRAGVILSGETGTGRNTIIEGLAQLMVEEEVPKILRDKRLVRLSLAQIVAGVTPSEAEERFLRICYEISKAKNIVLYIPDIQQAVGVQMAGVDLADVIAEEIKKGYFSCLSTTIPRHYTQLIESSSLNTALQKININEPETDLAIQILEAKIGQIEYQNKVFFSYDALEKAVELSKKFLHEYYLPEKAIEIAKETAHYTAEKKGKNAMVKGEDVAEIISQKTRIPLTSIKEEEREKLLRLEEAIHQRIIDQEEAVEAVSEALRRAKLELRGTEKPIANFLFLGPTGVGKTEMAKTVAEVFFGGQKGMIRLDMSEFQEKASVSRLLGSPEESGLLTEPVRKNPFSLLLLDEIEKAHSDVLNIFLAVMDDGRATDGAGRVIDFTNLIIIGTSNACSQFIQDELRKGLSIEQVKERLLQEEIKPYFSPEFLNRLDGIIVFKPLGLAEIERIADLLIKREAKRVEEKYGVFLKVTDEVLKELASAGFDPTFGARPLKRVIRKRIDDILVRLLLEKRIGRRDAVVFDKAGKVRIEKAREI
jgi:ATP-dependent Clp protease ATP-binding subunit ClpC